jgi:DNA-binding IclR family transcriptional regulator
VESGGLSTVEQALAVLRHLAGSPEPETLTRLAGEHATSKSRMHRILVTLRETGFASQDAGTARYQFGPMCGALAARHQASNSLTEVCLPAIRALWRTTEETVLLVVYQNERAVVVSQTESPRSVLARSELGVLLPVHAFSAGKVLLASRTDEEVDRILARGLERFTDSTCVDPDALRSEIDEIRRRGYAVNREEYRPGVGGVAAPVHRPGESAAVAAIGVCLPDHRFSAEFEFLKTAVVTAAAEASAALGASVEPTVRVA